ncbi:flavodoxin family protein [Candidatus Methanoprimaticola sp. MG2]|uniref:flavodoxin family protein n=1 Tax=Candidatus Methanoprimaticola sp. MG2 TaxID=3228838 RepID=UPI0039C5BB52
MKVMVVNGSSRRNGCTGRALQEVSSTLHDQGIETEEVFIGNNPMSDCLACNKCRSIGKCVIDDLVNEVAEKARDCDGFVFGSPVYYAHPSARILTFMDRLFYSSGGSLAFKPAAAVLSARRAGNTASMDVMNKYFTINSMPVVSSTYWNHVFGSEPEQVEMDLEGLQTMRNIGLNMAWMIRCIEAGKKEGIGHPVYGRKTSTSFFR